MIRETRRMAAIRERGENFAARTQPAPVRKQETTVSEQPKFHTAHILSATTGILFKSDGDEDNGFGGLKLLANHLAGESLSTIEVGGAITAHMHALVKQFPWAIATPAEVRAHEGGWRGFRDALIVKHGAWHVVESDVR